MVWTSIVEFDFQKDLFSNKGLIMNFSKENQLSLADIGADQPFQDHHHPAAYRRSHYGANQTRTNQTQKPLNQTLSFCQISNRREKALSLFRQCQ